MKTKLLFTFLFSLFLVASVNAQWLQQTSGTTASIVSIDCFDANTCMVAGTTTTLRKTTDGTTWNVTGSAGITTKSFIKMLNKDTVMLGYINGNFGRTTNGGTNWTTNIVGVTSSNVYYNDIAFISNTNFVAVGGNIVNQVNAVNVTATSNNTGASFTNLTGSGYPTFFGMHAIGSNTFVACGGAASIYKTYDGGANWVSKLSGTPTTTTLYDIHFPTPDTGYAVGAHSSAPATGGVVYKTIDKGETWTTTASAGLLPNGLFGVHFVSKDTGYVVGDGGKIQVTLDGGATWTTQISPVTTTLNKIIFPTKTTGYIAGASGVILKTTTGGFIAPLVVNAGADVSLCNGACTTLGGSGVASGGTAPYTYSWSPAAGSTSSLVVCPTITTTYTLTVTDVNNVVTNDSVKVTIFTYPAISISGLANPYCNLTTSDTLVGVPAGGVFSGPGISSDSIFNAATAGPGTHTITYTFTDTATGCSLNGKTTVTVNPNPTPVQICLVTVDSTMSNTQISIVWDKPAATHIDSFKLYRLVGSAFTLVTSQSYSANPVYVETAPTVDPTTQPYKYKLTIVDTCGIESAFSDTNATMHLPKPVFTQPATFTLNWTDYDGFTFTNYEVWRTINGGTSWTLVNTVAYLAGTHTYTDANVPSLSARYRIRATHPSGCAGFNYSLSNVTLDYNAVDELSLNSFLNVYPNPNHGIFNVEFSAAGYEVNSIKVYNMLGEVMFHSAEKKNTAQINIPGLAPGIYQLEVITDKGTANKKITIE